MGSIEGDSRAFGISGIGVRAETPQASFIDSMGASAFVKILTANRDRRLVAGGDGVEWLGGEVARRPPAWGWGRPRAPASSIEQHSFGPRAIFRKPASSGVAGVSWPIRDWSSSEFSAAFTPVEGAEPMCAIPRRPGGNAHLFWGRRDFTQREILRGGGRIGRFPSCALSADAAFSPSRYSAIRNRRIRRRFRPRLSRANAGRMAHHVPRKIATCV